MTDSLSKDETFIRRLTQIVLANLGNENFSVRELAQASGMSLYALSRRLHSVTGKPVNQFIREVRLHKALDMLQNEEYKASEVAYKTGFGSPAYFNKCFHEYFGFPPGKVKNGALTDHESGVPPQNDTDGKAGRGAVNTYFQSFAGTLIIVLVLVMAGLYLYRKIHKPGSTGNLVASDGRISLAVMPFQNMTNDTLLDIWQTGVQVNLITSLSNSEELMVRQVETVNAFLEAKGYTSYLSINPAIAASISQKLDAAVFVSGNISQAGNTIRLNARLNDAKTEELIKSFQIDGNPEMILQTIDSLSALIHNCLLISKLEKERPDLLPKKHNLPTQSPEAYRYYSLGQTAFFKNDFPRSIEYFLQALSVDSSLVSAMSGLSHAYYDLNNYTQGREWCIKSREKYALMSLKDKIRNDALYALYFKTLNDRIDCLRQLLALDDQNPMTWFNIGDCYYEMAEDEKAIPEFEKALDLFHKWETKPYWGAFYYELGICYHRTGQYKKEKRLYKKADRDFPGDPELMDQHAWLALTLGDTVKANRYLARWTEVRREQSWSEVRIARYLAYVYDMAGDTLKTEMSLRKALSLEPENPASMSSLANFLIDYSLNVDEGMQLIEKALAISPDNYNFLHNKGWGLYRQGIFDEAVEILQKSWAFRMQNSIYNHKAFLHLEEARKAASI